MVIASLAVLTCVYALPGTSSLYGTPQHISKANVENSLEGVHLTIVTTEDPPFIIVRDGPNEPIKPWNEWSGWIPEMTKETAKVSGFTYTLQLSSSKCTYGGDRIQFLKSVGSGRWSFVRGGTPLPFVPHMSRLRVQ